MRAIILFIAILVLASSASQGAEVKESGCAVLAKGPSGKIETILPQTNVLEPTRVNKTFSLMLPKEYSDPAIQCFRSDVVPAENDWKVVRAGYPLYIIGGETRQTVALELLNGQFQIRSLAGQLSDEQKVRLQSRLDQLQTSMQDADRAAKASNH